MGTERCDLTIPTTENVTTTVGERATKHLYADAARLARLAEQIKALPTEHGPELIDRAAVLSLLDQS